MTPLLEAYAVAVALTALDGDVAACERLLAMADEYDDDVEWFRDEPEGRDMDKLDNRQFPWSDTDVLIPDDADLPWADEVVDDPETLPVGEELSETEAYIYGGGPIFATSSVINEWKYDGEKKQLYIQFKGNSANPKQGRVYRLDGVTFRTAMDFYKSDSPGRYFNWFLKGRYKGDRLGYMPAAVGPNVVRALD